MFFLVTITYPTTSAQEMGKAAVENIKSPLTHAKRAWIYTTWGGDGLKAYSLYEIEKGYEDEGLKELNQALVNYMPIPGFKAAGEVVLPIEEALPLLGLGL